MIKIICKDLEQDNIDKFLRDWGLAYADLCKKAFKNQGWEPNSWAPRMVPNIAGILTFLNKEYRGGDLPKRFFEKRPVLHDTGMLESSIKSAEPEENKVDVGTSMPYAPMQHYGLVSTIPITGKTIENLKVLVKKKKYRFLRPFINKTQITIKPRPRKIFGWNDECDEVLSDMVKKHFLKPNK